MRIGLLGGSFDPPHVGHLLIASDAVDALRLDRLVLVPAAYQPLKQGQHAPAEHRLAMTRLLVEGDARFEVDPVEIERGGLSYTVDTLTDYAARYPAAERFFLVGADVLESFAQWREPDRVRQLATIAVMQRKGDPVSLLEGMVAVPTRRVDVSSTEIRARVRAGLPVRGFVAERVADYIAAHRLYR